MQVTKNIPSSSNTTQGMHCTTTTNVCHRSGAEGGGSPNLSNESEKHLETVRQSWPAHIGWKALPIHKAIRQEKESRVDEKRRGKLRLGFLSGGQPGASIQGSSCLSLNSALPKPNTLRSETQTCYIQHRFRKSKLTISTYLLIKS